jgi:hypothetical protein
MPSPISRLNRSPTTFALSGPVADVAPRRAGAFEAFKVFSSPMVPKSCASLSISLRETARSAFHL